MLKLNGIHKNFGDVKALQNITFELKQNECIAISGPTASGKTTLLRIIAGLDAPDSGKIFIHDQLASYAGWVLEPSKRNIGFVFQKPSLWPHMTVRKNIQFGLNHLSIKERRSLTDHLMNKLQILELQDRYPAEISGGESRLVAIARSLAPKPGLLLLDEPLVNLNPELKDIALKYIVEYIKENKTALIYVSHDIKESNILSDRVIRMEKGQII